MSGGIRFTQYPDEASPRQSSPADCVERCAWRALDPLPGAALVEYFAGAAPAPLGAATGASASYSCEELSDTGPGARRAPVLMIVAFDVPPERAAMVERWYAEEHIELLRRVPGWLRARRYAVREWQGAPRYTSLALHELADMRVLDARERAWARSTAWRAVMQDEPWFRAAGRFIYQRLESNE